LDKIYFAHPVNSYDTSLEDSVMQLIAHCLTGGDLAGIENPNQPCHQEGYKDRGMNYFFDEVLPNCRGGCVALPFLDGRMGLGVAGEAKWFVERGMPVWVLEPTRPGLFCVRPLTSAEESLLLRCDERLVVGHEETRLRTWLVYSREKRPYEVAHLVTMPIPDGFYPDQGAR
jgi:hypothetical protein